jgi:hypothetical protein
MLTLTSKMRFGVMRGYQEQTREGDLSGSTRHGWTGRSKADNILLVRWGVTEVIIKYSSSDDLLLLDPTLYRTIVWSLVYLTIINPDIAYVVHVIASLLFLLLCSLSNSFFIFCDIFEVQSFKVFYFHTSFSLSCVHILMLIMTVIPQIASLLLVSVSFWVILLCQYTTSLDGSNLFY